MRHACVLIAIAVLLTPRWVSARLYALVSSDPSRDDLQRSVRAERTEGGQRGDLPGEQPHSAHFNSDFQSEFSQFGAALVNQFVSLPLPSPTSGFTYQFDPSLGVFQRTTHSFGPILAERADTLGAQAGLTRVCVSAIHVRYGEGIDLNKVPAVFTTTTRNCSADVRTS